MQNSRNIIIGIVTCVLIALLAWNFIAGASKNTEARARELEQEIEELKGEYARLSPLAALERLHCERSREMEDQLAAINRLANGKRAELATYLDFE